MLLFWESFGVNLWALSGVSTVAISRREVRRSIRRHSTLHCSQSTHTSHPDPCERSWMNVQLPLMRQQSLQADCLSLLTVHHVQSYLSTLHATYQVHFCLLPRRFFIDELSCGTSGGGATEFLRCNIVSRTMCFTGLVSPSLRSSNKRAAVVPSW